jgi:RND family efflux transporter MFP subunit
MATSRLVTAVSFLALAVLLVGCRPNQGQPPPPAKLVVPVSHPLSREVTDYVEYTGRTDAVESVGIRARVTGYLVRMPFKEGVEVKKGDLLFEIDPRPYQAQFDQAESQVKVIEAQLKLAEVLFERSRSLVQKNAASQQEVDQNKAAVDEAIARVNAAKASLEVYRLNLSFTKVTSPIDGQVSRYYYTLGNLINQDQTLLTTVVSVDPMYAYFDMDERTVLRIRTAINEGRVKMRSDTHEIPVLMALEGEDGYPHHGTLDFVNNVVNPSTGTVAVRGVFKNPKPENGRRLFSPGMFVRIRLPIGEPHPALLVVDRALGSDQGLKYLYVVDAEHKVQYRRVKTGLLQDDGLRVIEEGVKPDDWVVVGGLQSLRPRSEVDTEQIPMPVPGAPTPPVSPPPGKQVDKEPKK